MPHIMIVLSPYYKDVSSYLLQGATAVLNDSGATYDIVEIDGALEIPAAIKFGAFSKVKKYDAFIALGCVLRGETSHYDIVCNESARGLMDLGLAHDLCIGNGILTCDNMDQAIVRSDPRQKNKGADVANAALNLLKIKTDLVPSSARG